ncbi:MAG: DEAD/DEAH box helicase family protein [Solirubrobacterales bacterium]|nr:DEAD/DEAH box helicase family protein [Solirubrobacterales bacterium]
MTVAIARDGALIDEIAARFDLRAPNRDALAAIVERLAAAGGDYRELVADLATGVGKTFLMAALVEYLAVQGVRNVLVVTPGSTIQRKTLDNFDRASGRYVAGADIAPALVTPENFRNATTGALLRDPTRLKVFVFNVQQLIRPTDKAARRVREDDEHLGEALYTQLETADDLVVIADEHHVYNRRARAFNGAIRDLRPLALVGLTATPDPADADRIAFRYTLGEAIADGHVKVPVIVYRKDGTRDERTQLADACQLLRQKELAYAAFRDASPDAPEVEPALFVVAQSIEHSREVGQILAQPGLIGDPGAVLEVTSESSDDALRELSEVERPGSPIRAIVSVNMLREGWDVRNIAVIVALRRLASQTLTEQILGRGLRLPFGRRTGVPAVDQVDLVAHDSYRQLLEQKDVLQQRIAARAETLEVDAHGAAAAPRSPSADAAEPTAPEPAVNPVDTERGGGPSPLPPIPPSNGSDATPQLSFDETDDRLRRPAPEPAGRVSGAPQIVFPRRESRLSPAQFSLSEVPDGDARAAGARFVKEVPTFIYRDALEAERTGDRIEISVRPQANAEAAQRLSGLDVVRDDLVASILTQPEVVRDRSARNAADRLVAAFLAGAGATSADATAEWGELRRRQAVEGMRATIRAAIGRRRHEQRHEFVAVTVPVEPIVPDPDARDAYNDEFARGVQYGGWRKSVMPVASFDARTTEWELAHLLDRDDEVAWWLRLSVGDPAYIPHARGTYFPDFVAIDRDDCRWLIEGKADRDARDADVVSKREAAETWARAVRDDGRHGRWRYLFATESAIADAAGSWRALLLSADPE